MVQPIKVYLLFYGRWYVKGCGRRVIPALIQSLSDTSVRSDKSVTAAQWWSINTKYYQADGRHVSSKVSLGGIAHDWYSSGSALSGAHGSKSVWTVLRRALERGNLPVDSNGAYMVLTSSNVTVGGKGKGFCKAYCGWHTYQRFGNKDIKFGFAGNAMKLCPGTTCNMHMSKKRRPKKGSKRRPPPPSPNRCYGPDGMSSTILHELAEIATDPHLNAWKTRGGEENADLCYKKYREGTRWFQGSKYNIVGSRRTKYLVQANLDHRTQKCVFKPS